MDSYNDISRFIDKLGENNLNYRSFSADDGDTQPSRWNLLNEVSSYRNHDTGASPAVTPTPSKHDHRNDNSRAPNDTTLSLTQAAEPHVSQPVRDVTHSFGHLFRQTSSEEAPRTQTDKTPLKALLKRIGS